MKAFAYIRYSSLNQKGNTTVDSQRDAILAFVKCMPELKGAAIVECLDEAKSGTTTANRVALANILRDAVRGDVVIVYKYDRLGRNLLESLQTLRGLEDRGVRVFSTTEPNTEVVRNLLLTMAQEFSRQLGERCKRALDSRAQGGHVANKPAFGYAIERAAPNGPGKFVPVNEQAAVVREIFESRSKGTSLYQIVKDLNDRGLRSPRGVLWRVSTIRAILRNEVYLGRVASGMRQFKKGHGLLGFRPRSEWTVCDNAHQPLVTAEIWESVRSLDCKGQGGRKATVRKKTQYLWSGFLKCRHCGANLLRSHSGRPYLGCEGGRKTGQRLPCSCRYLLHEEEVTRTVLQVLIDQVYNPSTIGDFKKKVLQEIKRLSGDASTVIEPLESKLKRLTQQVEAASRRLVHVAEDVQESFLDELRKLKNERDSLKAQISQTKALSSTMPDAEVVANRIDKRLARIKSVSDCADIAEAREILAEHVEKIEVATDGQAWLYPKPSGLLAGLLDVNQGNGYIPTGI